MSNKSTTDTLGYISCVVFILLLLPQIHKTYVTQSAQDLSWLFLFLNLLACGLMIPYSILLDLTPILISNFVLAICCFYLLYFKWYETNYLIPKRNKEHNNDNIDNNDNNNDNDNIDNNNDNNNDNIDNNNDNNDNIDNNNDNIDNMRVSQV